MRVKLGIVDTTFARVDMAKYAVEEIRKKFGDEVTIVKRTVPGIKDIAVEAKKLLEKEGCDVCLAVGMLGKAPEDAVCGNQASMGIMQVKLLTNKHVVEAFVHENEAFNERDLVKLCKERARKHALNAIYLVAMPEELEKNAGKGLRQGREDAGPLII